MGNEVLGVDIDGVSCELEDDLEDTVDDGDNKIQCGELIESQASIHKLDFVRDWYPREKLLNTHSKDTRPRNKRKDRKEIVRGRAVTSSERGPASSQSGGRAQDN